MQYTFIGKNMTIPDNLKEKAEQKLNRLKKIYPRWSRSFGGL